MKENRIISIKVIGKVQGVGFRYYSQQKAEMYGIRGFVKNKLDGSVYIEAQAIPMKLELFIESLRKGPARAYVENLVITDLPDTDFKNFSIKT